MVCGVFFKQPPPPQVAYRCSFYFPLFSRLDNEFSLVCLPHLFCVWECMRTQIIESKFMVYHVLLSLSSMIETIFCCLDLNMWHNFIIYQFCLTQALSILHVWLSILYNISTMVYMKHTISFLFHHSSVASCSYCSFGKLISKYLIFLQSIPLIHIVHPRIFLLVTKEDIRSITLKYLIHTSFTKDWR